MFNDAKMNKNANNYRLEIVKGQSAGRKWSILDVIKELLAPQMTF